MAKDLCGDADVLRGLERLVSSVLGVSVVHLRSEAVMPPRTSLHAYIRTGRTHTKHVFNVGRGVQKRWADMVRNGTVSVFVKAGGRMALSTLENRLSAIESPDFRLPYFFGTFECSGFHVGVWEFVEGTRERFEDLSLQTQIRLVRAVAAFNSVRDVDVAPKSKWVSEPLTWYERRFSKLEGDERAKWERVLERVSALHAQGPIVERVIAGRGEYFLTHNDINPNNVFTPETGDIVVFDWEGATLSVPGADLRFLVRMETRDILLDAYIERMGELGTKLERSDVRRAFEIVEGFRMVFKGWAATNVNAVVRGLGIAETHILPCAQPSPSTTLVPDSSAGESTADPRDHRSENQMSTETAADTLDKPVEAPRGQVKEPSPELVAKINEYVAEKGHLYAPIDHPAFASLPARWLPERFDLFKSHLDYKGGTALDIGSHWGYMAHRLEDLGYKVTANEHSPKHLYFLRELRDISDKQFEVVPGNIFNMKSPDFDVIFALNIFHHFLKTDERFNSFKDFLDRTNCRMMIYQAHRPTERPKLSTAGHYMEPAEMAKFIADRLRLSKVVPIGKDGGRDVFKLAK